jgi:hypothetical protein
MSAMSPYTSPKAPLILLACALGISLAACGSSGGSASSGPSPSRGPVDINPTTGPSFNANTDNTIAANWTTFFNDKTPAAKRISLLQNGQTYAAVIQSQAGTGLAASATADVTGVEQLTSTTAKVVYNILLAGVPALKAQSGTAVLQGGTWKVGDVSFCGLLLTEAGGSSKGLPAACKSVLAG